MRWSPKTYLGVTFFLSFAVVNVVIYTSKVSIKTDRHTCSSNVSDSDPGLSWSKVGKQHSIQPGTEASTVSVRCIFTSIDITYVTSAVSCDIRSWGEYSKPPTWRVMRLSRNTTLVLVVAGVVRTYSDGQFPEREYVTVMHTGGTGSDLYPDVPLPFKLDFMAYVVDNSTIVPLLVMLVVNQVPMFEVKDLACVHAYNYTSLNGTIYIDPLSRRFVETMNVFMWLLTGATFWVSLLRVVGVIDPLRYDMLCFSAALLFALPAMRDLLPAAPPSGTWFDLWNIHPQLWIVASAILLQLFKVAFLLVTAKEVDIQYASWSIRGRAQGNMEGTQTTSLPAPQVTSLPEMPMAPTPTTPTTPPPTPPPTPLPAPPTTPPPAPPVPTTTMVLPLEIP
jgi:hypothetical protein